MKKIKLNDNIGTVVVAHDYVLDPKEEYLINFEEEKASQDIIALTVQTMGMPKALDDYHQWLKDNNLINKVPSNKLVKDYFGKAPLWKTDYSQGIVVKIENHDDYAIIMECSRLNTGYKYTKCIVAICD